jgi:hypothetical protein
MLQARNCQRAVAVVRVIVSVCAYFCGEVARGCVRVCVRCELCAPLTACMVSCAVRVLQLPRAAHRRLRLRGARAGRCAARGLLERAREPRDGAGRDAHVQVPGAGALTPRGWRAGCACVVSGDAAHLPRAQHAWPTVLPALCVLFARLGPHALPATAPVITGLLGVRETLVRCVCRAVAGQRSPHPRARAVCAPRRRSASETAIDAQRQSKHRGRKRSDSDADTSDEEDASPDAAVRARARRGTPPPILTTRRARGCAGAARCDRRPRCRCEGGGR